MLFSSYKRLTRVNGFHRFWYLKVDVCTYEGICVNCGRRITVNIDLHDDIYKTDDVMTAMTEHCPKTKIDGWNRNDIWYDVDKVE